MAGRFDDEYWMRHDLEHEFPWEFYDAMPTGGWIGIAIPEEYGGGGPASRRRRCCSRRSPASGGGMNGCSTIHLSIFGMDPVVKHGSEELKRRVPAPAADGSCTLLRRHRARRRHRHHAHHDVRRARRRRLHRQRAQGVDHQGAGVREGAAAHPHHAARRGRQADRRHDAVPHRHRPRPRSTSSPIPKMGRNAVGVQRGVHRRPARARRGPGRRGGQGLHVPARRPQPRADPDRRRGARHRPGALRRAVRVRATSASCSAGRSA